MKVLTATKIREADAYTIEHEPIDSIDLMERAAEQLFRWISERYSIHENFLVFVGPGNNGGDGWALASMLWLAGHKSVTVYLLKISDNLSPDSQTNRSRLTKDTKVKVFEVQNKTDFPAIGNADIIIDGLFGSGLSRPLDNLSAELVSYLNGQNSQAVISIDIPSGLFSENNKGNSLENGIHANYTLSFQVPKLAFFFPENDRCLGEWQLLPIGLHPDFLKSVSTPYYYTGFDDVWPRIQVRKKFSHKGSYGHALLIAGSYGMMGAAVLAARSAVRSGVGLLTTHVPRLGVNILQTVVPESLLSIDESDLLFTEHPNLEGFSAIAIGPGINQKSNTRKGLLDLLKRVTQPLVIDADALNILSSLENWMELIPENSILTPHPKEFERLFGEYPDSYSRLEAQLSFSEKLKSVIVLKGANTCITVPEGEAYFNSTGNPGMAKGGCGDVLTGIILGLLAQGYSFSDAAIIGVYVHGMAGDMASGEMSETGAIPSDIVDNIGKAFNVLEKRKKKF